MLRWFGVIARLVVGAVLVWAGWLKLPHPESSITAVRAYQILSPSVAETVGRLLPILEVVVGLCLIVGLVTRVAGVLAALLMLAFVIGISSVWARGISIDCGCFGGGGVDPDAASKYPWEIARDVGLMALALWLVWRPRTPFSVDALLFPASAGSSLVKEDRVQAEP
ncbi:MAG: DoxX family rane protein [Nocardioidaceae bacterium]|nr:DoxX family rane protein [Nocardioidaceae bacterium]